jgi:allantoate deiminase
MERLLSVALDTIGRCRALAELTEEPGFTTRTFLSAPMREVHARLRAWMESASMSVRVDSAGNIRGCYDAARQDAPRLYIGSHLDTVPRAGAFDGVLGVVLGVAVVEVLAGRRLPFHIEVIGFSEEEGVRFGVPFIGSRALAGTVDAQLLDLVSDAVRAFGLDPSRIAEGQAGPDALGYLEFHIEQGPVLESLDLALGVVDAIAGQSRLELVFEGQANHAATPMSFRHDALAGAAEWIGMVEREACATAGLAATVGRLHSEPGAANAIPGMARASLDLRHREDAVRQQAVERLLRCAEQAARRRGLSVSWERHLDQAAVKMDAAFTATLERALAASDQPVHRMTSGAGHDAMILAARMPVAMLFLRSPGGISHHPSENVLPEDVAAALQTGLRFLEEIERSHA